MTLEEMKEKLAKLEIARDLAKQINLHWLTEIEFQIYKLQKMIREGESGT